MTPRAFAGSALVVAAMCGACSTGSSDEVVTVDSTVSSGPVAPAVSPSPSEPSQLPDTDDSDIPDDAVLPTGFSTITARITDADGEVCEVCVWLADDGDERGRGLMGVTDLGDAVGMAFRFDEARIGSFYMFQTPTPLSIAWFGSDGDHVGSADMDPCLDTPAGDCPLYAPDAPYDLAIEVFAGGLAALGLGPGANVELIDGTEADRCPS
jgi:uncharacterized membrane protein (UPF0127 family)